MVSYKKRGLVPASPLQPNSGKRPPFFKYIGLLLVASCIVFAYKHFTDAYEKVGGEWVMKPEFKEKLDDKIDSYDECEVYYLLAISAGLFECLNCEDGLFYLYPNEIAKIGMTCSGRDRYKESFYEATNVRYKVVFMGNSHACQQEEIKRLGQYALRPENLARPDPSEQSRKTRRYKLLYPVLNSTLK